MDAKELVKKLTLSSIMQNSVAIGTQLGLPWLEKRKGMLLLSFRPHKEVHSKDGVVIYPQQYEVAWVYPFTRVALFRDMTLDKEINVKEPVCIIPDERMLGTGKYRLNELYDECTRVITKWEKEGDAADAMITGYQKKYADTVETLKLEALYGSFDNK